MATPPIISTPHNALPALADRNRRLVGKLLLLTGGAFSFGFALVPLYDTLCRVSGLNGKSFGVGGLPAAAATGNTIDLERTVTVEFTSTVMPGLPWEIRPLENRVDVHPGQLHTTRFLVHNRSGQPNTGQAVPSVSPGQAAAHFDKIECFCFSQQAFAPGEARELPLTFVVRPGLDAEVRTITLAYAFFNVTATQRRTA